MIATATSCRRGDNAVAACLDSTPRGAVFSRPCALGHVFAVHGADKYSGGDDMTAHQSTCSRGKGDKKPAEHVAGVRIIVVDDDTAWLADLETWLEHEGFHVVGISRGEWVLEAVDFHQPDVVLVDLQLPGVDGLHLLGQLRRRWPGLPVIVMTAFGGTEVEQRVRQLGAAGYFDKPFRLESLVAALRVIDRRAS